MCMRNEEGVLKHTTVYTFVQNSSGLLKNDAFCTVYAFLPKFVTRFLRKHVLLVLDDYSLHASNVLACSRLERCSFWPVSFSAQVLVICSSAGLPHGGVCRFQGCNVKAWSGSLDTAFNVDEASVKEAVVAHVSFLCLQCSRFVPVRGSWRVPTCAHS